MSGLSILPLDPLTHKGAKPTTQSRGIVANVY
jgi:hypothetical protein